MGGYIDRQMATCGSCLHSLIKSQSSLGKWLILGLRQEIYKISQEHLVVPAKKVIREFPDSPTAKTPCSHCQGPGFNPWLGGGQILQVTRSKIKIDLKSNKTTEIFSSMTLLTVPHQDPLRMGFPRQPY